MRYEITYACGHTGYIELYGKQEQREWIAKQREKDLCPECYEAWLEEENRKAAAQNAADGLPPLTGSEKQILWAESIRQNVIKEIQESIDSLDHSQHWLVEKNKNPERQAALKSKVEAGQKAFFEIQQITSAPWWIDHQGTGYWEKLRRKYLQDPDKKVPEILEPEKVVFDGVVFVKIDKDHVSAAYDKNPAFRDVLKKKGFYWGGLTWCHDLTAGANSLEDLAADTVNTLIAAGFKVKVDGRIAEMVKTGKYIPFNIRQIIVVENRFRACFERDSDLRDIAESLPKSTVWDKNDFFWASVPIYYAEEVAEFAEIYGFSISKKASEKIDEVIGAKRTTVIPKEDEQRIAADAIYNHDETEVIPDLIDD